MRGFSGGALAGVAVGAAALAGLSLLASPSAGPGEIGVVAEVGEAQAPGTPPLAAAEAEAPAPSEPPLVEDGSEAAAGAGAPALAESAGGPAAEPAPMGTVEEDVAPEVAPAVAATAPEELSEPGEPATLDVAVGEASGADPADPEVRAADGSPAVAPSADLPVPAEPARSAMASLPEPEVVAAEPVPEASPSEEPVPSVEPPVAAVAPEVPEPMAALPMVDEPAAPDVVEEAPVPERPEAAPVEPGLAQAREPSAGPRDGVAAAEAPAGPQFEAIPASEGEVAPSEPEGEAALPGRIAVGGQSLPGRGPVRINRPGVEEEVVPEAAVAEAAPETPAEVVPALRRFAAAWDAPAEARPLMSLVLLDDGTTDPAAVAALPWPVSVALDPSREGAAERLAAYRAQGIEALVLAELPPAAQPVDVEVFLGAALDELPETVAVLDMGQGGLAGLDATAQMAMSRVARDGRGLVLGDGGLRSGLGLAEREGVPAAEVLRDLDGEGQDGAAIRRGLDDAVRRAGQEGQAVVIGRMRPETLAALDDWSQEGRVQEVTMAPVSAVLGAE